MFGNASEGKANRPEKPQNPVSWCLTPQRQKAAPKGTKASKDQLRKGQQVGLPNPRPVCAFGASKGYSGMWGWPSAFEAP